MERHARLMRQGRCAQAQLLALAASTNAFRAVTEIVLYTPDHPGLFSQFAGAIAMAGGSIVDAKVITTSRRLCAGYLLGAGRGGRAVRRSRPAGAPAARPSRRPCAAKSGRAARCTAKRPLKTAPAPSPSAQGPFRQRGVAASPRVIEVEGLDRPGFLYDVTQALFEAGLSISASMIATYGERAVDVFYVRDGFGHKIRHPQRIADVTSG